MLAPLWFTPHPPQTSHLLIHSWRTLISRPEQAAAPPVNHPHRLGVGSYESSILPGTAASVLANTVLMLGPGRPVSTAKSHLLLLSVFIQGRTNHCQQVHSALAKNSQTWSPAVCMPDTCMHTGTHTDTHTHSKNVYYLAYVDLLFTFALELNWACKHWK